MCQMHYKRNVTNLKKFDKHENDHVKSESVGNRECTNVYVKYDATVARNSEACCGMNESSDQSNLLALQKDQSVK